MDARKDISQLVEKCLAVKTASENLAKKLEGANMSERLASCLRIGPSCVSERRKMNGVFAKLVAAAKKNDVTELQAIKELLKDDFAPLSYHQYPLESGLGFDWGDQNYLAFVTEGEKKAGDELSATEDQPITEFLARTGDLEAAICIANVFPNPVNFDLLVGGSISGGYIDWILKISNNKDTNGLAKLIIQEGGLKTAEVAAKTFASAPKALSEALIAEAAKQLSAVPKKVKTPNSGSDDGFDFPDSDDEKDVPIFAEFADKYLKAEGKALSTAASSTLFRPASPVAPVLKADVSNHGIKI